MELFRTRLKKNCRLYKPETRIIADTFHEARRDSPENLKKCRPQTPLNLYLADRSSKLAGCVTKTRGNVGFLDGYCFLWPTGFFEGKAMSAFLADTAFRSRQASSKARRCRLFWRVLLSVADRLLRRQDDVGYFGGYCFLWPTAFSAHQNTRKNGRWLCQKSSAAVSFTGCFLFHCDLFHKSLAAVSARRERSFTSRSDTNRTPSLSQLAFSAFQSASIVSALLSSPAFTPRKKKIAVIPRHAKTDISFLLIFFIMCSLQAAPAKAGPCICLIYSAKKSKPNFQLFLCPG